MKDLDKSSHNQLNRFTAKLIKGDTLFERIGRAVCEAECLPRKELFESWEAARRIRRKMRGGPILELAAGHGLLSAILILLDDSSPNATCVDLKKPESHDKLMAAMARNWPRLEGRIRYVEQPIKQTEATSEMLLACVHGCGSITDQVLSLAMSAKARVAVLPCCHDLHHNDCGNLQGWIDGPTAVDVTRAARLREAGYQIFTAKIPEDITPKNRLLLGWPANGQV